MKTASTRKSEDRSVNAVSPVQDRFLTEMVKQHQKVAVFLANGLKLVGEIVSFDQYVILMQPETTGLVYKHAVSTVQPIAGIRPTDRAEDQEKARRLPTIVRRIRRVPERLV